MQLLCTSVQLSSISNVQQPQWLPHWAAQKNDQLTYRSAFRAAGLGTISLPGLPIDSESNSALYTTFTLLAAQYKNVFIFYMSHFHTI